MSFERLVLHIGWGRYQVLNTIYSMIGMCFVAMHVISSIFIAYPMPFQCYSPEAAMLEEMCNISMRNSTFLINIIPPKKKGNGLDHCRRYEWDSEVNISEINCSSYGNASEYPWTNSSISCKKHIFVSDGSVETSIVEDFDLVCDRAWYKYLLQAVFMFGVFLTGIVFGKLSDRFGRKSVVGWMNLLTIVFGVAIAFVTSLTAYTILRGIVGFFCFHGPILYVLASETTAPKRRAAVVLLGSFGFSIGTTLLAPLAYFLRRWVSLQLAITSTFFLLLVNWWFLDESPRWLLSRGRNQEAVEIIRKIVKTNNCGDEVKLKVEKYVEKLGLTKKSSTSSLLKSSKNEEVSMPNEFERESNLGMLDTLKTPNLRKTTVVLTYAWFSTSCAFYGLTLNVANIGGDIYINSLTMGLVALLVYPPSIYLCEVIGRRIVISACFILVGVFCVPMYFLPPENVGLQLTMFMIGRMFTLVPFSTLFLYTIELYPTVIRSTAVGYGSAIARVGAIVAPAIAMTEVIYPTLPNMVFGVITFLAGVLILLLPETRIASMAESMEEAELFIKNNPGPLQRLICRQPDLNNERESIVVKLKDSPSSSG